MGCCIGIIIQDWLSLHDYFQNVRLDSIERCTIYMGQIVAKGKTDIQILTEPIEEISQ